MPMMAKMIVDSVIIAIRIKEFQINIHDVHEIVVTCIIRATNLKTQRTKEYVYKRQHAAEQKVLDIMDAKTHEFTVCTHDSIHYVGPNPPTDD